MNSKISIKGNCLVLIIFVIFLLCAVNSGLASQEPVDIFSFNIDYRGLTFSLGPGAQLGSSSHLSPFSLKLPSHRLPSDGVPPSAFIMEIPLHVNGENLNAWRGWLELQGISLIQESALARIPIDPELIIDSINRTIAAELPPGTEVNLKLTAAEGRINSIDLAPYAKSIFWQNFEKIIADHAINPNPLAKDFFHSFIGAAPVIHARVNDIFVQGMLTGRADTDELIYDMMCSMFNAARSYLDEIGEGVILMQTSIDQSDGCPNFYRYSGELGDFEEVGSQGAYLRYLDIIFKSSQGDGIMLLSYEFNTTSGELILTERMAYFADFNGYLENESKSSYSYYTTVIKEEGEVVVRSRFALSLQEAVIIDSAVQIGSGSEYPYRIRTVYDVWDSDKRQRKELFLWERQISPVNVQDGTYSWIENLILPSVSTDE